MSLRFTRLLMMISVLAGVIFAWWMSQFSVHHILDTRFFYSRDEALLYFQSLSAADSRQYLWHECADVGFLISYTTLSILAFRLLFGSRGVFRVLPWMPGTFDLAETLGIISALVWGPQVVVLPWLGWFTCLKWSFGFLNLILAGLSSQIGRPAAREIYCTKDGPGWVSTATKLSQTAACKSLPAKKEPFDCRGIRHRSQVRQRISE